MQLASKEGTTSPEQHGALLKIIGGFERRFQMTAIFKRIIKHKNFRFHLGEIPWNCGCGFLLWIQTAFYFKDINGR